MKRYILLGIGIGIIFTNIVLSFVHGNKVDIDKLVEEEVQKRLKNIETYQKVDETFKEVVKEEKSNETLSTGTGLDINTQENKLFPGETGPGALYYLYFYNTNVEKDLIQVQKKIEDTLETKIEKKSNKAYLFSESKYTQSSIKEILEMVQKYNLKARKVTEKERQQLMETKMVKTKTKISKKTSKVSAVTNQTVEEKVEQVVPKIESSEKEIVKEEVAKEVTKEEVAPKE